MLFDLYERGGWLALPILACSVLAVAIVIDRFLGLRQNRILPQALEVASESKTTLEKQLDGKPANCRSSAGKIALALLNESAESAESPKADSVQANLSEVAVSQGRQEAQNLGRYLDTLGTIASIAPLLGLLGTVVGMIKVFEGIEAGGIGDSEKLAGGISEALISTALGLAVAIPSLAFHRYLKGQLKTAVHRLEVFSERVVKVLSRRGEEA